MKKVLKMTVCLIFSFMIFVGCAKTENVKAIELMGAGDRIHDTYTFANNGVSISDDGKNTYTISGSVEKLTNQSVKDEFDIVGDIEYVVAIKLTAINEDVIKDEVVVSVNGVRNYDSEHLNGSNYTFIILEAIPDSTATITVKWNNSAEEKVYVVYFKADLNLK